MFVQSFHDSALGDVPDHQPANLVADQQMLAIGREDRGCELESLRRKIWPEGERGKIPDLELAGLMPILMTRGHQEPPVGREGHAVAPTAISMLWLWLARTEARPLPRPGLWVLQTR